MASTWFYSASLALSCPFMKPVTASHSCGAFLSLVQVLFVCTTNMIEAILTPLLDRMEVIVIVGYITDEKMHIVRDYLENATREACGIKPEQIPKKIANPEQIGETWEEVEMVDVDLSPDQTTRVGEQINSKVDEVIDIGEKVGGDTEDDKVVIDVSNLVDFVGKLIFHADKIYDHTPIRIVMGLAWTALGRSILYIETTLVGKREGKCALHIAGQLGDVMKECPNCSHSCPSKFV
ncbi:Lon protease like 1, mitochondrial [Dendrobium catenatum]|uniref:Lon protease like 1, mitochondrial n=1 Tax=Dendrobium catenatum TaxID=906689 RepID=A0A2I0XBH3_9ASPA|nr:Lon protease like 1, mitochondrial [Dendrobium catenatum]